MRRRSRCTGGSSAAKLMPTGSPSSAEPGGTPLVQVKCSVSRHTCHTASKPASAQASYASTRWTGPSARIRAYSGRGSTMAASENGSYSTPMPDPLRARSAGRRQGGTPARRVRQDTADGDRGRRHRPCRGGGPRRRWACPPTRPAGPCTWSAASTPPWDPTGWRPPPARRSSASGSPWPPSTASAAGPARTSGWRPPAPCRRCAPSGTAPRAGDRSRSPAGPSPASTGPATTAGCTCTPTTSSTRSSTPPSTSSSAPTPRRRSRPPSPVGTGWRWRRR